MRQKVHSSWCVALGAACFVAGVTTALWVQLSPFVGLFLIVPLIACVWLGRYYALPILAVCAFLLGVSYGSLHMLGREQYNPIQGHEVLMRGAIKEDIGHSTGGSVSIQLDHVFIDGQALPGTVLVTGRSSAHLLRGDTIQLRGTVRDGLGSFPATVTMRSLLAIERQPLGDIGRVVRDWFADGVRRAIPEPEASLGVGFLTGQKSALPSELSDSLKIAGLTHIVVASGYNLTILVRVARKLLLRISKYISAVSAAAMIIAFVTITGLSPSMTRAGLVSGLSLLAWYYGHAFHPLVLLPLAAAATVVAQPSYAWGDMGWQLSFTAFLGVMIIAPLLHAYFFGNKEPGTIRQILGETIAAHIVTVPIIALGFGTISNVAIIANIVVVPLVPLAMLLTFLCGVWSLLGAPFLVLLSTPTVWLLGYMTHAASYIAELPWAQSQLTTRPIVWVGYGLIVATVCLWMWRKTRYSFRDSQALLA